MTGNVKGATDASVTQCDREVGAAYYKLAYSVFDACQLTGLSRSTLYDLHKEGVIRFVKCGRRTLILHEDLAAFLQSLPIS
jgi:excisionase family DNA binding protein